MTSRPKPSKVKHPSAVNLTLESLEDRAVMDATYHSLATTDFSQNWTSPGLIAANDDWSGALSIIGYLGDGLSSSPGTDPQTVLGASATVDVVAQSTAGSVAGGVHEIEASQTIALQGSGGANAPHIVIHLNTTGRENVLIDYKLKELDAVAVDQKFALQYRLGNTGNFTNVPGGAISGFFTTAGNQTVSLSVPLPTEVNNQEQVQVRIITNDAPSTDAMVGVDDIVVTSTPIAGGNTPPTVVGSGIADVTVLEDAADTAITLSNFFADAETPPANLTYTVHANTNTALFASTAISSNQLTLDYAPNASGAATITIRATDAGGLFVDDTFVVTVTAVNDAPTLDAISNPAAINEDAGLQTVNLTGISAGPANEAGQTLAVTATSNNPGLIPNPTVDYTSPNATGSLTFTPVANASGTATITVTVTDNGGPANGGVSTTTRQFTVTVNPVADTPTVTNATTAEDTLSTTGLTITRSSLDGPEVAFFKITNITNGTLFKDGTNTPINNGDFITIAEGANLDFAPAGNANSPAGDTFGFQVQGSLTNVGAGSGLSTPATAAVAVTEVNDAPTAGNDTPAGTFNEDGGPFTFTAASLVTNDTRGPANESGQTLTITNVVVTSGGGSAQVVGGDVEYTPAANANGPVVLTYTVTDNGTTNGVAAPLTAMATISFTVTAMNDAPVNSIPGAQTTPQNTPRVFSTGNGNAISISDADAGTAVVQVALTANNGTITLSGTGGLTTVSGGNGTGAYTFSGTIADINTALDGLSFNPTTGFSGGATLRIVTSDLGNTGGAAQSDDDTISITVAAGNTAPVVTLPGPAVSYTENAVAPTIIDSGALVTDPDSPDFDTGTLTVDYTAGGTADDRLEIRDEGLAAGQISVFGSTVAYNNGFGAATIGTFVGGSGTTPLVVTFDADATRAAVEALVRNITFRNVSEDPATAARTVRFVVTDGDGGTSTAVTETINVTAVNDAPTLTATGASPTYTENGGPVALFTGAAANTVEAGQSIDQIVLTVTNVANGASELIRIDGSEFALLNGTTGTTTGGNSLSVNVAVSGGTATVTFGSAGFTTAAAATIINGLGYRNSSDNPTPGNRVVTITSARDTGGAQTSNPNVVSTVAVVATNDTPTLNDPADVPAATAGVQRTVNLTGITAGGGESQTLTVTATSSNQTVIPDGNISVTYTSPNSTGVLTFTPAAAGMATITVRVTDNNGTTGTTADDLFVEQTFTVTVSLAGTLAPVVTSPTAPTTVNAATFPITGTAAANSLVKVYSDANNNGAIDGSDAVVGMQQLTGGATDFSISTSLTQDAANNFLVTATAPSSAESAPVDVPTITEDSTAPLAPVVTDPSAPTTVSAATFTVTGTVEANSLVEVYRDANDNGAIDGSDAVVGAHQLTGGATAFSVPTSLTQDAANNFLVTATDAVGNRSIPTDVATITEDSTAPTGLIVTDPSRPDDGERRDLHDHGHGRGGQPRPDLPRHGRQRGDRRGRYHRRDAATDRRRDELLDLGLAHPRRREHVRRHRDGRDRQPVGRGRRTHHH